MKRRVSFTLYLDYNHPTPVIIGGLWGVLLGSPRAQTYLFTMGGLDMATPNFHRTVLVDGMNQPDIIDKILLA